VKKITKWGIGLVMTLAVMFMAGQAGAVVLGYYSTGQLVPKVYHDGANVDTVAWLVFRALMPLAATSTGHSSTTTAPI